MLPRKQRGALVCVWKETTCRTIHWIWLTLMDSMLGTYTPLQTLNATMNILLYLFLRWRINVLGYLIVSWGGHQSVPIGLNWQRVETNMLKLNRPVVCILGTLSCFSFGGSILREGREPSLILWLVLYCHQVSKTQKFTSAVKSV